MQELLATGAPRDSLTYRALRTLVALDPRGRRGRRLDPLPHRRRPEPRGATIHVVDRGGIARDIPSRTDDNPMLRGTKHRAASEREVTVVRGRADGRTLIIVPEVKGNQTTGLTLLHVRFHDRLPAEAARRGPRGLPRPLPRRSPTRSPRSSRSCATTCSATIDLVELLTEPVVRLADRWRS